MTKREAIEEVLKNEIEKGQSAWEMVQDGYAGDVEAYLADYVGDYEAENLSDGRILVTRIGYSDMSIVDGSGHVEEVTQRPRWYAVQETSEDDWGIGSRSLEEAVKMLKRQGSGLIAVIEDGESPICVDEISFEEANEIYR